MDTPELMRAIAKRLSQVPGVAGSYYPALNQVPVSPCVFVIDGSAAGPTVIHRDMRKGAEHLPMITVRILVKSQKDRPREATKIDSLIDPILDALSAPIREMFVGLSGHVARIWDTATVTRGHTFEYSGEFCYAADIALNPKFHRVPVATLPPTDVTPQE